MTPHADAHASPDASFLSVLYDITRKHPVIFIALFLLPLLALVISLVMKWHYVFTVTSHYLRNYAVDSAGVYGDSQPHINVGVDRVLRELDVAGLLGGIVGIFIGLLITVTTEKLNWSKERHNQQEMDRIRTQTSLLVQATESLNTLMIDVSGKVNEKVHMMEGTREVLSGITRVIESVGAQGNNLLVLSNTARIEGISPYRMEYVAKHANLQPHEFRNLTQSGYAEKAEASAPMEHRTGIYKGLSVCILGSGSSTSGRASKLTAFLTDDPHIVSSMTELFFDYENDAKMATREFMAPVLT